MGIINMTRKNMLAAALFAAVVQGQSASDFSSRCYACVYNGFEYCASECKDACTGLAADQILSRTTEKNEMYLCDDFTKWEACFDGYGFDDATPLVEQDVTLSAGMACNFKLYSYATNTSSIVFED